MTNLIKLSKKMSFVLRHDPESAGLALNSSGQVSVSALCGALGVSETEVREVVANDSKGRFCANESMIWAAQGHSVDVELSMTVFVPTGSLFHGTKIQFLPSIFENGLLPMSRKLVHLSENIETALDVACRRAGESVILEVDAVAMVADGLVLKVSSNGVILAETVPSRFLKKLSSSGDRR